MDTSIVEYLKTRGIEPAKTNGDRYIYLCPLHKENTPSFVVFCDKTIPDWFCYGCSRVGRIEHLASALEGIPFVDAKNKYGYASYPKFVETYTRDFENNRHEKYTKEAATNAQLFIATGCRLFISSTNFNKYASSFVDKIYEAADRAMIKTQYDVIFEIAKTLPERLFCVKRILTQNPENPENII